MRQLWAITAILTLSIFAGCQEEDGGCEQELEGYRTVDYEHLAFDSWLDNDTSYLFNDDSSYQAALGGRNPNLPEVQFDKYSVIGRGLEGICATNCYEFQNVLINESEGIIIICINHKSSSLSCKCKKEVSMAFLFAIPKISDANEVKIQLE